MTPLILAIDTTTEFGSLALAAGGKVIEETPLYSPDGFGHILWGHLEQLLRRRGITLAQVDCLAAAAGPGAFTGVRVGLAAAKGLAEAAGKPVVAVSNLRAMAWFGSHALRATVADARRGEVYGAVYDAGLETVVPERVMKFAGWLQTLPGEGVEFVSTNFAPFQAALDGTAHAGAPVTTAPRALAAAIARIACQDLAAGRARDPAAVDANYVRRSDAELGF